MDIRPELLQSKDLVVRTQVLLDLIWLNTKCFCVNLKDPTVQNAHFSTKNNAKSSFFNLKGCKILNTQKALQCKMLIYQS